MKYAIIENEEFARLSLIDMISSLRPDYECVFWGETVEDAVEYLSGTDLPDLVLIDVELDDGNCFDIFRQVETDIPVIFTTAYDEYALNAFKVNSVDYLLKPVAEDEAERALTKFENYFRPAAAFDTNPEPSSPVNEAPVKTRTRILVNNGQNYHVMQTSDIAWFEAEEKYVSIVTKGGKGVLTDFASLAEIADAVDGDHFFQISRSVLASIDAIVRISKYFKGRLRVELTAGERQRTETVSAARRDAFLDWLGHAHR